MKTFNFISPLAREECLRRLRMNVEPERWMSSVSVSVSVEGATGDLISAGNAPAASKSGVVGKIGKTEIRLRKSISDYNSFQTYLFGRLADSGSQTRLRCRVGVHPLVFAFMAFWFGVVFLIGVEAKTFTISLPGYTDIYEGWWVPIVGIFMLCFLGVAIVLYCRFLARDEEKYLIDFLRRTLDVRDEKPNTTTVEVRKLETN